MTQRASRLLLFDIDGTLTWGRGIGRASLDAAFHGRYGWKSACTGISFAGATDPLLVRHVFEKFGRSADEARAEQEGVFADYMQHLHSTAADGAYYALPGAQELIATLTPRADCVLAVLTGNIEAGARVKLRIAGFGAFWSVGAFGDEAPARNDLLPLALERANALRRPEAALTPASTVVIGDTPRDIAVARAHGARAVAVATGACSSEDLAAHEPDALLAGLDQLDAALDAILG